MRCLTYSHRGADKIIPTGVASAIETVLGGVSRPLRKRGAPQLRQEILALLRRKGWSDAVRISAKRGLTITAKHGKIALCLQTGNMARFYADLLKLQAQFLDEKITSAVYVLPTRAAAVALGDNLANYERLTAEVRVTFPKVITVPLLIFGFDAEKGR